MASPSDHGRGADQTVVRFPDGLRDLIKAAAAENGRSMNAEIMSRLEASFASVNSLHREIAVMMNRRLQEEVNSRLSQIASAIGRDA
ncbi:Arc family DNA-binding protein [Aureimonas altamirensis]|uniref:Arc-like DNA binding domain-containing protein n=1 Tax=Aureimonas altamirensis TaxID=370622 RepID=A0A0P0YWY5_9HYPH|nr:Arc family DNA-binding protein [Aureimonas altamirensis]BAT26028.1 hypothetical protein [Aureimonas altamirensis]